jgi:hypothetical protein
MLTKSEKRELIRMLYEKRGIKKNPDDKELEVFEEYVELINFKIEDT